MIENFFRPDLKDFKPYIVNEEKIDVKLDANESCFNIDEKILEEIIKGIKDLQYNRYPCSNPIKLKELYGKYAGVAPENIIIGNGSDELILMIASCFLSTGDKVLMLNPDFSMYKVYSQIAGATVVEFDLEEDFNLDYQGLIKKAEEISPKIIFISNPNNPTGRAYDRDKLIEIIKSCNSIVVVDEAYFEFNGESLIQEIKNYENLIILRTCSKALGAAAARLGIVISNKKILNELLKIKSPFNISTINQAVGVAILSNTEKALKNLEKIVAERIWMEDKINSCLNIRIYPSKANFLLLKVENLEEYKKAFIENKIAVRSFSSGKLNSHIRITIGIREENEKVISCLKNIEKKGC